MTQPYTNLNRDEAFALWMGKWKFAEFVPYTREKMNCTKCLHDKDDTIDPVAWTVTFFPPDGDPELVAKYPAFSKDYCEPHTKGLFLYVCSRTPDMTHITQGKEVFSPPPTSTEGLLNELMTIIGQLPNVEVIHHNVPRGTSAADYILRQIQLRNQPQADVGLDN